MCGRIAQAHTAEELQELLGVSAGADSMERLRVGYNVPPTSVLPTLVSEQGHLCWSALKWGFKPPWMRKGRGAINARSETVAVKPMFRHAMRRRRCVVVATAYYEWLPTAHGKQPYCIRAEDSELLFMAGIYEAGTCAILTRDARDDLAHIHDRMPVLLPRSMVLHYADGTDDGESAFTAAELLPLYAFPVTKKVGNYRYGGRDCMEPL